MTDTTHRTEDAGPTDGAARTAEGIPTRAEFDAEVAADVRTERRLLASEVVALTLVIALVVARQLWFL